MNLSPPVANRGESHRGPLPENTPTARGQQVENDKVRSAMHGRAIPAAVANGMTRLELNARYVGSGYPISIQAE